MGCCSSQDDYRQDDDDDVLVFPINGQRRQPQVVTRQPPAPPVLATRTSNFVFLEPSHMQTITTSSTYLRPPAAAPIPRTSSRGARTQPTVSVVPDRRPPNSGRIVRGSCEACGQSDHLKADCRYRNRLCFYCREEGHIISVCPNKRRKQTQGRGRGRGGKRRGF